MINIQNSTCEGEIFTPRSLVNSLALLDSRKPPPVNVKEPSLMLS